MKNISGKNYFKCAVTFLMVFVLGLSIIGCSSKSDDKSSDASVTENLDQSDQNAEVDSTYSLIQNVYNWGSNYSKAIIPVKKSNDMDYLKAKNYSVFVQRYDENKESLGEGERTVIAVYFSNEKGEEQLDGNYVTLVMGVGASSTLASPYYSDPKTSLKTWATCQYTIQNTATNDEWNELNTVYHPDEESFKTDIFTGSEKQIPYASYEPETEEKRPLVVWLHGAGSGGTDIGFVTGGMLVTNFVSEEVQDTFGGAYILLPQAETRWMDSGDGNTTTDGSSIYTESLMALIEDYVENHPNIDTSRIYIGGCSNGGYMTMRLIIDYPDYFAAAFPICEAYQDSWITDEQIQSIKDIPMWFVHSKEDPTVDPLTTVVPTYERIKDAGAKDLHFTYCDKVTDPEYGNTYTGHFTWVYSLLDLCNTDYDGKPVTVDGNEVTLYQWLSLQSK